MRLKEHGKDIRKLLEIKSHAGSFLCSPPGLLKVRSSYPLVFQIRDHITIRLTGNRRFIKLIKWDERFCDDTATITYPADRPLSKTFFKKHPELLYALLVGMDEYGLSAHPESELLYNYEKGGVECSPAIKSLSVPDMLCQLSAHHGLRFSVKDPYPLSLHVEVL